MVERRFLLRDWRVTSIAATGRDPWIAVTVAVLIALGTLMVFNTSYFYSQEEFGDPYYFFRKHLLAVAVGAITMGVASRIPSFSYRRLAYAGLPVVSLALLIVLCPGLGVSHGKALRWIRVGPLSLQPSEFAKGAVVLYLAHFLIQNRHRLSHFFSGIGPPVLVVGMVIGLVALEPDFGTATLIGVIAIAMLFVAGARWFHLFALLVAGGVAFIVGVIRAPYRVQRFLSFLNPWQDSHNTGFQLIQSYIAFGSGGMWGVGLGESKQKMFYLPEAHTDFVFSVIGEEMGLWGTCGVLGLFVFLALRGLRIAARHPQAFGSLLAFGVTLILVAQAVVNIAVVLGLLPTKGLALPFVSYGGSALVAAMLYAGILLALSREVV